MKKLLLALLLCATSGAFAYDLKMTELIASSEFDFEDSMIVKPGSFLSLFAQVTNLGPDTLIGPDTLLVYASIGDDTMRVVQFNFNTSTDTLLPGDTASVPFVNGTIGGVPFETRVQIPSSGLEDTVVQVCLALANHTDTNTANDVLCKTYKIGGHDLSVTTISQPQVGQTLTAAFQTGVESPLQFTAANLDSEFGIARGELINFAYSISNLENSSITPVTGNFNAVAGVNPSTLQADANLWQPSSSIILTVSAFQFPDMNGEQIQLAVWTNEIYDIDHSNDTSKVVFKINGTAVGVEEHTVGLGSAGSVYMESSNSLVVSSENLLERRLLTLTVSDLNGRTVSQFNGIVNSGTTARFDLPHLTKGIYNVSMFFDGGHVEFRQVSVQ